MKTTFKIYLLFATLFTGTLLHAQTENTSAFANLISPLTITETSSLHFGTMTVSAAAGTCVLSTANVRTATGGVTLSSLSPTSTNAAYNTTGSAGLNYLISLPTNMTVTRNGGSETMTIDTFKSSKTGNLGTIGAGSSDNFTVGATLHVAANQLAGLYQGTFNVTVAYN
ncbi:MAG: hypothetical protein AUK44_02460 [Porphyromonadaceae bacterium CG2_30_38_12]|nr:MAG: hypothetical protein AUK44_02460 [Porphyromonadaceae bacterium CG2_30_38_12]